MLNSSDIADISLIFALQQAMRYPSGLPPLTDPKSRWDVSPSPAAAELRKQPAPPLEAPYVPPDRIYAANRHNRQPYAGQERRRQHRRVRREPILSELRSNRDRRQPEPSSGMLLRIDERA